MCASVEARISNRQILPLFHYWLLAENCLSPLFGDFKIPPKNNQLKKFNLANQHTLYSQCIEKRQIDYKTATKQSKKLV